MRKSQYCYERAVKGNSHESPGIKKGEKASVFLENTTETTRECGNMDSKGHSDEVSDGSEEISLETGEDHPKPWTYNPSLSELQRQKGHSSGSGRHTVKLKSIS